jgi:hypothetical protein
MAVFTPVGETFSLNVVGDATKTTWAGEFTVKTKLSWRDQLNMDKMRRELLGPDPQGASQDAVAQAVILSELAARLTDAPKWWTESKGGIDLYDDNVLTAIYEKVRKIINDADKVVEDEGEEARVQLAETKKVAEKPTPKGNRKPIPVEE